MPTAELSRRLHHEGLRLQTGPVTFCIRSDVPEVHRGLSALYAEHGVVDDRQFADFHIRVCRVNGVRRWIRRQLQFGLDGTFPFAPMPGGHGLPMIEWGMNWCVSGLYPHFLTLHAAVLERNGLALVMPAPSGSGKSTLCAALLLNGWRLLSDELALIRLEDSHLIPMPRPVSLKNASIELMQRASGGRLQFASLVHDTVKGTVGHFAAPAEAVRRSGETAAPGWVVFPKYTAGAPAQFSAVSRGRTLLRLIENAFNYNVQGGQGFEALANLVEASQCSEFSYSSLSQAIAAFDRLAQRQPVEVDCV